MGSDLPDRFVVFDTEFTAWEGSKDRNWTGPNEYRELVQIGAVCVSGPTFEIEDEYQQLLKPKKNPTLSDYFIRLTGITQEKVNTEGRGAEEALPEFAAWVGELLMYCYGKDGDVLMENCELVEIQCPFQESQFHNVKDVFQAEGVEAEKYMSSTIVEAFGAKPSRRGHDALHDALTIVDGLRLLRKQRIEQ